jgi:hypothetical protein
VAIANGDVIDGREMLVLGDTRDSRKPDYRLGAEQQGTDGIVSGAKIRLHCGWDGTIAVFMPGQSIVGTSLEVVEGWRRVCT